MSDRAHRLAASAAAMRRLALGGIVGPLLFALLVVVQGLVVPGYSHVRLPISALAAWPTGWVQNASFFVFGALTIGYALGLHGGIEPSRGRSIGTALLALGGLGLVASGMFPWVMVDGVPTETRAHVIGALLTFPPMGLGLLALSRGLATDGHWRDLATYTLASGVAVLVLFVTLAALAIDQAAPLHAWVGLIQRIVCTIWFACFITLGLRLRRLARPDTI